MIECDCDTDGYGTACPEPAVCQDDHGLYACATHCKDIHSLGHCTPIPPPVNPWTYDWPTEVGSYLFYGDLVPMDSDVFKPKFLIAYAMRVRSSKPDEEYSIMVHAGGGLLDRRNRHGKFKRFHMEPPSLEE